MPHDDAHTFGMEVAGFFVGAKVFRFFSVRRVIDSNQLPQRQKERSPAACEEFEKVPQVVIGGWNEIALEVIRALVNLRV